MINRSIVTNNDLLKQFEEDPGYFVRNQRFSAIQIVTMIFSACFGIFGFLTMFDYFNRDWQ
jgi:hypothetical protein